jgi:hypothetical protein
MMEQSRQLLKLAISLCLALVFTFSSLKPVFAAQSFSNSISNSNHLGFIWLLEPLLIEELEVAAAEAVGDVIANEVPVFFDVGGTIAEEELLAFLEVQVNPAAIEMMISGLNQAISLGRNILVKDGSKILITSLIANDIVKETMKVYNKYKETRLKAGNPINPCKPVTIRPQDSDKVYDVYDSDACSSSLQFH